MYAYASTEQKAPDGTGYNELPKGWREVPDLVNSQFMHYNPVLTEHRQAPMEALNGQTYYTDIRLEWFHDGTGIAFVIDRTPALGWGKSESEKGKPVMRFFQFGCDHKYREVSWKDVPEDKRCVGSCIHHYICDTCGHFEVQDSSD